MPPVQPQPTFPASKSAGPCCTDPGDTCQSPPPAQHTHADFTLENREHIEHKHIHSKATSLLSSHAGDERAIARGHINTYTNEHPRFRRLFALRQRLKADNGHATIHNLSALLFVLVFREDALFPELPCLQSHPLFSRVPHGGFFFFTPNLLLLLYT